MLERVVFSSKATPDCSKGKLPVYAEEFQKVGMGSDERCFDLLQYIYEVAEKLILHTPIVPMTALLLLLQ